MVRLKTKWHRSKRSERNKAGSSRPKQLKDLSSVIAMNIWKLAKEAFTHMEKEGFRFRDDEQAIESINEFMFYQLHIVDRMIYTKVSEDERGPFINAVAANLIDTMVSNQQDLLGEEDYRSRMLETMNLRLGEYAECDFNDEGPSYEFTRHLAHRVAEQLQLTDDKWVVEQVIDIEAPPIVEKIMRVAEDVLGLRYR